MIHPMLMDLKNISYEELDRRYNEVSKRMQKLRAWGQSSSEMWGQFQMILDAVQLEKEERLIGQDTQSEQTVLVTTDPLEEEIDEISRKKRGPKQYTVL
jgi:hypothetical protein